MQFTEQHEALKASLESFIEREINPHVDAWEDEGIFPAKELFKKMGDAGFLGINMPEEFGGAGLDYSYGLVFAETVGTINCGALPMAIGVQTDMATPALARFGNDDVRERFLRPSISGDYVACLGVSEPSAGSDVSGIRTTARKDGDDYIINGTKMWTTNGTQADWMCLLAITDPEGGVHHNKSLICVPMDTPGISTAPRFKKLGMHSSDTTQVFFEDVRVPQANLIGEEGKGFAYQMSQFQIERLWAGAAGLRSMENLIAATREYAAGRKLFGQSVIDFQSVAFRLAELETEVELLRSLTYRAAELHIAGEDVTRLATMVKLKAGRLSREVSDACLQYWGGMGYMWDSPVARSYRDSRLGSIGGGADEVMLQILSRQAGS
ncbi:putative acyl-CoA dehydrogenase [Erythrobacter sp. NAP1]|uniref:acyl-CoA dehydrogenase family protein n=1 Tax=Erythrobacter sp. NAP1 TaxID=237727 RepID=UPI0000685121|nr:acyl-CoA dehydrogenase family protein [Erythrobacter sp. NAP1]EAQ27846.1 putative acyl-CoA dehydrogenase [Erythrobacter sp. NAP1]